MEKYRPLFIGGEWVEPASGRTIDDIDPATGQVTAKIALGGREDIDIELYRYPGPKPTFKEAAILMLADFVEAASRTVAEPTPPRLKDMIHNGILTRLQDGELDDSEITLRELSRIEESFLRTLSTQIFHGRIPYPKSKEAVPKAPASQNR